MCISLSCQKPSFSFLHANRGVCLFVSRNHTVVDFVFRFFFSFVLSILLLDVSDDPNVSEYSVQILVFYTFPILLGHSAVLMQLVKRTFLQVILDFFFSLL